METASQKISRLFREYTDLTNKLYQRFYIEWTRSPNSNFGQRLPKKMSTLLENYKLVSETCLVYEGRLSQVHYTGNSPILYTGPRTWRRQDFNEPWFCRMMTILVDILLKLDQVPIQDHVQIRYLLRQLENYSYYYQFAVVYDRNDMFNFDRSHPSWEVANSIILPTFLPGTLPHTIKKINKMVMTGSAIMEGDYKSKNSFTRDMKFAGRFLIVEARKKNVISGDIDFKEHMEDMRADAFANGNERGAPRLFVKAFLPNIDYVRKVYLRRCYPRLTEQSIQAWGRGDSLKLSQPYTPVQEQPASYDIFKKNKSRLRVRILAPLPFQRGNSPIKDDYEWIIYHLHGGGYCGQSSFSHQTYLRRWVKYNKVPVISVDYLKPPKHFYPVPLDDCWQCYNWLLYESHNYFCLRQNKKIILTGDSAGGHFVYALTNLCILVGAPRPDFLLPFYPCSTLHIPNFTPCFLYTVDDPMLSTQFLAYCIRTFIPPGHGFDSERDYLISPRYAPLNILKYYPPVRLFLGTKDPLHDDSIRLAVKIKMSGVDIKVVEYQGMIHAFLSLDMKGFLKEGRQCVEDSIKVIESIIRPYSTPPILQL